MSKRTFEIHRRRILQGVGGVMLGLPALESLHWPGVLNLEVNDTKPVWGLRPGLVDAFVDAGWELDAHTITHPDLTQVPPARLWTEVDDATIARLLAADAPRAAVDALVDRALDNGGADNVTVVVIDISTT